MGQLSINVYFHQNSFTPAGIPCASGLETVYKVACITELSHVFHTEKPVYKKTELRIPESKDINVFTCFSDLTLHHKHRTIMEKEMQDLTNNIYKFWSHVHRLMHSGDFPLPTELLR